MILIILANLVSQCQKWLKFFIGNLLLHEVADLPNVITDSLHLELFMFNMLLVQQTLTLQHFLADCIDMTWPFNVVSQSHSLWWPCTVYYICVVYTIIIFVHFSNFHTHSRWFHVHDSCMWNALKKLHYIDIANWLGIMSVHNIHWFTISHHQNPCRYSINVMNKFDVLTTVFCIMLHVYISWIKIMNSIGYSTHVFRKHDTLYQYNCKRIHVHHVAYFISDWLEELIYTCNIIQNTVVSTSNL